jgi:hypothetical protein
MAKHRAERCMATSKETTGAPSAEMRARTNLAGVDGSLFHKTQRVFPGVFHVEGSFAPGAHDDTAAGRVMNILARDTV